MNTYAWISIVFGMALVFYTLGYHPLIIDLLDKYSGSPTDLVTALFDSIIGYISTWNTGLVSFGLAVVTGSVLFGLNLMALVPFGLAFVLFDLVVFPMEIITGSGLPPEIILILVVLVKLPQLLAVVSFVRNG